MSEFLIISCSLNPQSKSRLLCKEALQQAQTQKHDVEFVDLRDFELPLCDGATAYSHINVAPLAKKIGDARCILLGIPIYNYDANAAAKNLVELTGRAWTDKTVGFICAAGGRMSYMSVMSLANSLMLDFRCLVIPRFVYSHDGAFTADGKPEEEIQTRIAELVETAGKMLRAFV